MSVRIRMKKLGRKHRPFFRICAVDNRAPRDGRVLEELGTYDPMIAETDARAELNSERFSYWLGVGAQMSDKVKVLFKKYGPEGTHLQARDAALAKRSGPKVLPELGAPAYVPKAEETPAPAEESAPPVDESATQKEASESVESADSAAKESEAANVESTASATTEDGGVSDAATEEDKSE